MKKPEYDIWCIKENTEATICKTYKRRWFMLLLFILYTINSVFHWCEYLIVADVLVKFYNISYNDVEWTALIFILTYLVFSWIGWILLEKLQLRWSIIIGTIGVSIAAWIKVLSTSPDRFWVILLAQAIAGISQITLFSAPAKLAATWFAPNEVSSVCGIGIFGILFGVLLGYVVPVPCLYTSPNLEIMRINLQSFNLGFAVVSSTILIILLRWFEASPPVAPAPAQMRIVYGKTPVNVFESIRGLLSNPSYCIILVSYSINVGSLYTIVGLIHNIVFNRYGLSAYNSSTIGLVMLLCGMVGCVWIGIILDKFQKFKGTALITYLISFSAMICFTIALMDDLWIVYITVAVFGFSTFAMLTIGYELTCEITYPEPQSVSCGLLATVSFAFGIVFRYICKYLLYNVGDTFTNLIISGALLIGTLLIILIPQDYKRQAAQSKLVQNRCY